MTGRDDKLPSVLVLAQDGRTAPLRTLTVISAGIPMVKEQARQNQIPLNG